MIDRNAAAQHQTLDGALAAGRSSVVEFKAPAAADRKVVASVNATGSHLVAFGVMNMILSMLLIETISTEEAGAALGLKPVSVRRRIHSGQLSAVFIGHSWRIGLKSVNALLSAAEPKRIQAASPRVSLPVHHPAAAPDVVLTPPEPPQPPAFSATDLAQISQFRLNLSHPDAEIRAQAKWQLDMFELRAKEQATWKPPASPLRKPSPEALLNLF